MALLLRSKTADNGSTPRFPSGETARHRGFNNIPFGEASICRGVARFPLCETTNHQIVAVFPLCETTNHQIVAVFPLCEMTNHQVIAVFPLCQMTLRRGKACFPPCEVFIAWAMEEFPCRKLIRDGYGTHCLPAISFEIFTDGFLYIAIYLEKFTEQIATSTKSFVKLTKEIATLQSGL